MDYKLQIQNTRRVPHTAVLPDLARTSLWSSALALWSRFKVQTLAFLPHLYAATCLSPKAMLMLIMFLQTDSHHGSLVHDAKVAVETLMFPGEIKQLT